MNPVAANWVEHPQDNRWSSARVHRERKNDKLVKVALLFKLISDWSDFLSLSAADEFDQLHRKHLVEQ